MNLESSASDYDFKKLSSKDWWDKIDQDLKGKPREKLNRVLVDGIETKPFYHYDKDQTQHHTYQYQIRDKDFLSGNSWLLGQKFYLKKGNEKEILKLIKESISSDTQYIELNFSNDFDSKIVIEELQSFNGKVILTSDNLNALTKVSSTFSPSLKNQVILDSDIAGSILEGKIDSDYLDMLNQSSVISINSKYFVEKGANEIQEGIYTLACLNRMIELNKGRSSQFLLRLNTGSNIFLQIAKFRSLRNLSAFILKKWGIDTIPIIEAQSSTWNKSVYDRFTNILRLSSESFASVVGGVDVLNISGFEESLGIDNAFTYRNARNISHLLKHESHLDKVLDQAAGSYFVETLCDQYSQKVWEGFREIEKAGGISKYNSSHSIDELLEKSKKVSQSLFGNAKIKMVGTNTYPNPLDELTEENIKEREPDRLANKFEELRTLVDMKSLKNKGKRPISMILKLGNSEMRFARAGFSLNFLECAGIKIIEEDSISKNLNRAELAVICASDEDYIQSGLKWIKDIKSQNSNVKLILAGNPENREKLEKAGVDFFIHLRAPLEFTLSEILKSIGIE